MGGLPFLDYINDTSGRSHADGLHRLGVQLLNILSGYYNFQIHWVRGVPLTNTFQGDKSEAECLEQFKSEDVNFSASAIAFSTDRIQHIDSGLGVSKHR